MEPQTVKKNSFFKKVMRPFLTGLIMIFPLVITIIVIVWVINFLSGMMGPESGFGGLLESLGLNFVSNKVVAYLIGLSATLVLVYFLGLLVQVGLRNQLNYLTDNVMKRIPLIRTIYDASRKLTNLFELKDQPDMKSMSPVLCYFGGKGGTAVLALLTSREIITIDGNEYYSIMIPSSPVPVGGAILYVPVKWVEKVDFGIDGLVNVYVSMGVTGPEYLQKKRVPEA